MLRKSWFDSQPVQALLQTHRRSPMKTQKAVTDNLRLAKNARTLYSLIKNERRLQAFNFYAQSLCSFKVEISRQVCSKIEILEQETKLSPCHSDPAVAGEESVRE